MNNSDGEIIMNANLEESQLNKNQMIAKRKSLRKLDSFKKGKGQSTKSSYKSINISLAGASIYFPDSSTFRYNNTKVMWIFIGHTRLESGMKDSVSGNLLLDEESDITFDEIIKKNKTLVKRLSVEDYSTDDILINHSEESSLYEENKQCYQKYEVTIFDINMVYLNNLAPFFKDIPVDD